MLIEDDLPHALAASRGVTPAKNRTLVADDGSKYSRHSTGEDQLFDLVADPDEVAPLQATDTARRAQMLERLADALIAVDDDAHGTPVAV